MSGTRPALECRDLEEEYSDKTNMEMSLDQSIRGMSIIVVVIVLLCFTSEQRGYL